ncbi:MAG: hypothetical protein DRH11_12580 [Deltaproteobacteria bacterium]|nr:MAG: hypothetical protein DRH11_12580 [Deltaproteobacteria bacterium]
MKKKTDRDHELLLLRMHVTALREQIMRSLEAIEARIECLLPEDKADMSRVPTREELMRIAKSKSTRRRGRE